MKIYLHQNVFDAALDRIRWLFDEFPNIIVGMSGGKDSTVVFNLALQVAKEKGRLPLPVFFIDQEAEWASVITFIRSIMNRPDVQPLWLQCPIKIFNATSNTDQWMHCWGPGEKWMREKEPNSIQVNRYGTDRFHDLFRAFLRVEFAGERACYVSGVRCEESPTRFSGLTKGNVFKGVTWGKPLDRRRGHYTFYPLYDWSYTDVWKAIHDNGWPYCAIYDAQYQHGMNVKDMRVSNVHHETSVKSLEYLQEVEAETWNALTARLSGINTIGQMQGAWYIPKTLPPMFADWREYRDHLFDNLITDPVAREKMRAIFDVGERSIAEIYHEELFKLHVTMVLVNDYHGTKWSQFAMRNQPKRRSHQSWMKKRAEKRT